MSQQLHVSSAVRQAILTSAIGAMAITATAPVQAQEADAALDEVVVTNTIPLSQAAQACAKIRQVSVAPLMAETIARIASGESVMSLFADQENLF
jgi:phosphoribosylpyrophosphate synthetase